MRAALLIPALLAATPALAQDPATDSRCATVRVAIPPEFATWSERTPVTAGTTPRTAPVLSLGRGADVTLAPGFAPVVVPAKAAQPGTPGGLAMFQVARAGTYRVALGAPAWIEVVRQSRALPSVAHGHGPMCTGIRKIVDFRLRPGRYVLQLTGAPAATVPVLIARKPA
jgi:hypothetical protein